MKKIFLLGLLVMMGVVAKSQSTASIKKVSINDVKAMMDTSTVPMIVNFWATWCGPCVREIPYIDSLIQAKGNKVRLLLVSLDFPEMYPRQLTAFVKKQGYKGDVVFLKETNADYFCPIIDKKWTGAIPVSVLVNNKKNIREFYGMQLTRERLMMEYDKLVGGE
jgi:thiol-disulfide isomerase/thioredoxin